MKMESQRGLAFIRIYLNKQKYDSMATTSKRERACFNRHQVNEAWPDSKNQTSADAAGQPVTGHEKNRSPCEAPAEVNDPDVSRISDAFPEELLGRFHGQFHRIAAGRGIGDSHDRHLVDPVRADAKG